MRAACVTTGVALLGAGVVAVGPIASMPPAIATATSTVRLAAAPKPLVFYPEVAQRTVMYAEGLATWYLSNPVPITRAVINNQVAAVSNIIAAVESGDLAAVLTAVGQAVMQPIENAIAAGGVVEDYFWLNAGAAVSPAVQAVASVVHAFSDVFAAVISLDVIDLVNSVLDIPAHLANGVLNGGYPTLIPFLPLYAGIFTPVGWMIAVPGPIAAGIALDQHVAQAISSDSAVSATPLRRPAASGRLNTAAPVTESGSPDPAPDTFRPIEQGPAADREVPGRVEADTAIAADMAVAADTAGAADLAGAVDSADKASPAVAAHGAPEASAQRPSRHGHRGDAAAESAVRTDR